MTLNKKKLPELKQMMRDRKLQLSKKGMVYTKGDIIVQLLNYMKINNKPVIPKEVPITSSNKKSDLLNKMIKKIFI